ALTWPMADAHLFLQNLALVLCVAAFTTVLFRTLRQPVIFGYLLAGLIIGPYVPIPLAADRELVPVLAETGVILLMFALGLEFSLRKMLRMGPTAGLIAVIQCSVMLFIGFAVGRAFGWTVLESVYLGAIIAIPSTTIVVKAFAEAKITGRLADVVFSVLIFEDLLAILLLAVLTTFSTSGGVSAAELARTGLRLGAFLLAFIAVGLLAVPRLVRYTLSLNRAETTLVTAVGICFASALLALAFGYSVALGAFIGGALVAESGQAHRIIHLVAPVRDLFAAIFFVAVGMLIDPVLVAAHWQEVLVLSGVVIIGTVASVSFGAFLAGHGTRTAVQAGMSLAQIGEFSFIIASVGLATGATRPFLYPVAIAISAITTLTTPWLIRAAAPAASWVDRKLPRPLQTFAALYETWLHRLQHRPRQQRSPIRRLVGLLLLDVALVAMVVIGSAVEIGSASDVLVRSFGWSPRVARWGVIAGAAVLVLPLVFGYFRTARRLGRVWAADVVPEAGAGKVDFGAAPRHALAVTLQLAIVVVAGIPLVAITAPFLPPLRGPLVFAALLLLLAIAWWRSTTDLRGHAQAGAEVLVSALGRQMATEEATHQTPLPATELTDVRQLLPGLGEPVAIAVQQTDHAVGRTLAALDLRSRTGAVVLAITRAGQPILLPTGHETIQAGDRLAVAGTRKAVHAAAQLLATGA
ncbi:MAG TPA: cation:proton antiporter, partial [Gemmatimonadales bacterium]|nr:cation:proton antiporter [Gemmatimonadales bacterium]